MKNENLMPPYIEHLLNNGALKYLGATCSANSTHVGLRYTRDNNCVECNFLRSNGIEARDTLAWVGDDTQNNLANVPIIKFYSKEAARLPSGRRGNSTLARVASGEGERFFQGSACKHCGCTLRFASTTGCVACEKLHHSCESFVGGLPIFKNAEDRVAFVEGRFMPIMNRGTDRQVRRWAEVLRRKTYSGYPCPCGGKLRYTLRGQCVSCNDARKKKTAPAQTGAVVENFDDLFD